MAEDKPVHDRVVRACLLVLTVIVSLAVLRVIQPALAPLLLAVPLACLLWPIHRRLSHRIGDVGSVIAMTVALAAILVGLIAWGYHERQVLGDYVRGAIIEVGDSLSHMTSNMREWAKANQVPIEEVLPEELTEATTQPAPAPIAPTAEPEQPEQVRSVAALLGRVTDALSLTLTSALEQILILGLALVIAAYLLVESTRRGSHTLAKLEETYRYNLQRELALVSDEVRMYFRTCLLVGLITGSATTLLTWAMGMPYPIAWGLLVVAGEFIPTLGAVASLTITGLVGLTTLPTQQVLLLMAGLITIQSAEGALLQPVLMGRALEMAPLLAMISLIFWGWLLGIVGAIMAVPLTTISFRLAKFLYTHGTPRWRPPSETT